MEEIVPIFLKAIQKQSIRNALHAMGLNNLKRETLHFMEYSSQTDYASINKLKVYPSLGCKQFLAPQMVIVFFTSVAHNLVSDIRRWTRTLALIGNDDDVTVSKVSSLLRNAHVHELLGERREQYEGFVAHCNFSYEEEAKRFSQSGFFQSELGNTMPLAVANIMQCHLIIFRKESTQITYVTPET